MTTSSLHVKSHKWTLFYEAPFILKAYFLASVFITIIWLIQVFIRLPVFRQINSTWLTFFPLSYAFGLYFITTLIFSTNQNPNKEKLRLSVVGLLSSSSLMGLVIIYSGQQDGLAKDITPLVLSISIMIIWIVLLQLPPVIKFCTRQNKALNNK